MSNIMSLGSTYTNKVSDRTILFAEKKSAPHGRGFGSTREETHIVDSQITIAVPVSSVPLSDTHAVGCLDSNDGVEFESDTKPADERSTTSVRHSRVKSLTTMRMGKCVRW